jgi:hypothetical protein
MFGTGVSDLFSAEGDKALAAGDFAAAQSYTRASSIAEENKGLSELSTEIQQAQLNRKITMTEGAQVAATGAANLEGGSAGDLMRMSIQQGALAKTLVATQGHINANAYEEQATAYQAMSASATAAGNAAEQAAKGATFGAAFSFLGGAVGLLAL